jgi:hypothetical protein
MAERRRKPTGNRLARILIARGWNVRAAGPPRQAYQRMWEFYRAGGMLVALNTRANTVLEDFECGRWCDSDWPPPRLRG